MLVRTQKTGVKLVVSAAGDVTIGGDPRSITQTVYVYILEKRGGSYSSFFENLASTFETTTSRSSISNAC